MGVLAAVVGAVWYWKLRPAIWLAANDTVVLADIGNQTSDPVFEDALNTALRIEFEQTPYFNLLGSDKVRGTMKLLGYPDDLKVTPENAREVCLRSNSVAVDRKSIADAGNRFRIQVSGIDAIPGRPLRAPQRLSPTAMRSCRRWDSWEKNCGARWENPRLQSRDSASRWTWLLRAHLRRCS